MAREEDRAGAFQRLHPGEKLIATGVGLATLVRIVKKHKGSIWAEAEREKGGASSFTLAEGVG